MLKIYLGFAIILLGMILQAQSNEYNREINDSSKINQPEVKANLRIGGYGEVHFNQPFSSKIRQNGALDVHRLVMLMEYGFNSRARFISEIEFEHVKEVFVEQAYLQYKLNKYIQFHAGLLLIPMGIINGSHEPVSFNGVERPMIDQKISPSTWREAGLGISGTVLPIKMKYQLYLVNGFNGYDGTPHLNGKDGLRGGRQKAAESFISSPDLASRIEYFGIGGFNLGLSGYFGKTESSMYNGIDKADLSTIERADSSVVGISMFGLDARFSRHAFQCKTQLYYTSLSNTEQYNVFTAISGIPNNLGSSMTGYYVEAGYNLFHSFKNIKSELIPFIRFEEYNTQFTVSQGILKNKNFNATIITPGVSLKLTSEAVLKADIQFLKTAADPDFLKVLNTGIAVNF